MFEDSKGALRSRDSLGNDLVIGPGGIVLLQAARGAMHEETPAETGRELHGAQIYVNLSSKNKLNAPSTRWLESSQVPEWRGGSAGRVRILSGSFEGVSSPLVPAEPFNLFDVDLRRGLSFPLKDAHNAIVYVLEGEILVRVGGLHRSVTEEHAIAVNGDCEEMTVEAVRPAHVLILSGAAIDEPVVMAGPFIMSDSKQIEAAFARFRRGEMGQLAPLPETYLDQPAN